MAYVDTTVTPADRARTVLAVGAIHVLLAGGVVAGLTVSGVIAPPVGVVGTFDVADEIVLPPPPPEQTIEDVPETARVSPPAAPVPRLELPSERPLVVERFDDTLVLPELPRTLPGTGSGTGDLVIPAPAPAPSPAMAAIGPRPVNGPVGWISTDDYPRRELMREAEGTASYRLVVGSNGRVQTCEITQGTGHSGLDAETCRLLSRRARFEAARDGSGANVVGTFTGAVTWQIP